MAQYTTPGLDPPPAVSVTTMPMAGLVVDVYGLEEAPAAPVPLTCLWLLHPRTRTRGRMADIARRTVHAWHQHAESRGRGLVGLAFDMPNHGSRLVSEPSNGTWDEGNDKHALDMAGMVGGGAGDMSALMDLVGGYLGRDVGGHVCLGWSLGGHAAWWAWVGEPRIDAAVVVVGCPDFIGLMSDRAKKSKLVAADAGAADAPSFLGSRYMPSGVLDAIRARDPKCVLFGHDDDDDSLAAPETQLRRVFDARIRGKKLLACSGAEDQLVPYQRSRPTLTALHDAVTGWYADAGVVVDDRLYPGVGHKFSADMVTDAVAFLVEAVAEGPRSSSSSSSSVAAHRSPPQDNETQ